MVLVLVFVCAFVGWLMLSWSLYVFTIGLVVNGCHACTSACYGYAGCGRSGYCRGSFVGVFFVCLLAWLVGYLKTMKAWGRTLCEVALACSVPLLTYRIPDLCNADARFST